MQVENFVFLLVKGIVYLDSGKLPPCVPEQLNTGKGTGLGTVVPEIQSILGNTSLKKKNKAHSLIQSRLCPTWLLPLLSRIRTL